MTVLLDSVVLIDHFRGIGAATAYLAEVRRRAAVSVITRAEVLAGFDEEDLPAATALLDNFPTLAIEKPIADLAARLRREHRWKLPDAFQAALARYHALSLATRNTRDFPPGRFAWVEVPYGT
ncbi:MAG TPA: PIN domain-containing protein [Thermoanaerobaculia bacterium]|nr:PIN domain-containing protein [Thermoanaerobaculia bacterium]